MSDKNETRFGGLENKNKLYDRNTGHMICEHLLNTSKRCNGGSCNECIFTMKERFPFINDEWFKRKILEALHE